MATRRLIAPASYTQGANVLENPASYRVLDGEQALLVGGSTALDVAEDALRAGLESAEITITGVKTGVDNCTFGIIEEIVARVQETDADIVVGVGGGVALDASKAAAERAGTELVIVPTIVSTDAPCSSVAVVYDEEGGFAEYVHRRRNPDLVIVDTHLVAQAPARFMRYGMGDAFATRFEAEAVARSHNTTHAGGTPTDTALQLARRSFRNLATHGEQAVTAVQQDAVTPAVERIVETNTLLSGIGFESGGLAGAHAFSKGFSRTGVKAPHGLLVAFGTIAQLVLEDRSPDVLDEALSVYHALDLTTTLADLGVDDELLTQVGERACADDTTMHNLPSTVRPAAATDALRVADELITQ